MAAEAVQARLWGESERRRLVRLCAALCGTRDAEDLAQETLLEAWRNVHKLRDPAGAERWLAAIARNVCYRWARRQGRVGASQASMDSAPPIPAGLDLEVELERAELGDLLDRALALLPPDTREVLVRRYVHESSHAEIGARLGISEDAVSMRLSRGKVVLRRLLGSQLRQEAAAYGLVDASDAGWRDTRMWCLQCGRSRVCARTEPGLVAFRCPTCNGAAPGAQYRLENPFFARLVGHLLRPRAIVARTAEWSWRYFAGGADAERAACTRCGAVVPLKRHFRHGDGPHRDGLVAACGACGEEVFSSLRGLAATSPEVRDLSRRHPRTHALPERELQFAGRRAILARYEDLLGTAGVDVLFARDTLRVLEVSVD